MRTFLPKILFILLIVCACTFADARYSMSTPEDCRRMCKNGEPRKICYYKFTVEWYTTTGLACLQNDTLSECVQADGVEAGIMTINRQLPGPPIEVCLNDMIVVEVENKADGSSITIHWHGVFQQNYQYYDGVPFVTQCPIMGGTTFRYTFGANNAGTHIYHSHESDQIMMGQYGILIVRDPPNLNPYSHLYDEDYHRLLISDNMHHDLTARFSGFLYHEIGQTPSNILINGRGMWNDSTTNVVTNADNVTVINVTPEKRYRIRIVNIMSSVCGVKISIENHTLILIAQDGEYVERQTVNVIVLTSGERVDVVLHASQEIKNYTIMAVGLGECEDTGMKQIAILRYVGTTESASPMPPKTTLPMTGITYNPWDISGCGVSEDVVCVSQLKSVGNTNSWILNRRVDYRLVLAFGFKVFEDLSQEFSPNKFDRFFVPPPKQAYSSIINNISYTAPSSPAISQPEVFERSNNQCLNKESYCEDFNYYDIPLDSIVEIVLVDLENATELHHPFHLHGYSFFVVDEGLLKTTPPSKREIRNIIARHEYQLANGLYGKQAPSKKDTVRVAAGGYVIMQFKASNPGFWFFHCHFLAHTIYGMDAVLKVGKQKDLPPVPHGFPVCGNFLPDPVIYDSDDS